MLLPPLKEVKINTLFARFVLEQKVTGKVYVNRLENPSVYYIEHPYGMSLLFGDTGDEAFNLNFIDYTLNLSGNRKHYVWMQAYPKSWNDKLESLLGEKLVKAGNFENEVQSKIVELNTRVNFKFNPDKYNRFRQTLTGKNYEIVRTDEKMYAAMAGNVVPCHFWDNADEFIKNGVGFSLFYEGKLATTAFSAYIFEGVLELGMETFPEYRGKGLAQLVCSALIDYCIGHNYEPVWSCRLENIASYNLAQKLGFEPTITLPYYRLNN
jgi:GNAT superfamily N-acetyltransferase